MSKQRTEWTPAQIRRFNELNAPISSDFKPRGNPVAMCGWRYNQEICQVEIDQARRRREAKERSRREFLKRYYGAHPELRPRV